MQTASQIEPGILPVSDLEIEEAAESSDMAWFNSLRYAWFVWWIHGILVGACGVIVWQAYR